MRQTGKATAWIYTMMLMIRSLAKGDTQASEGKISEVQQLCTRCPNIHLPRVNARNIIKSSDRITARDCVAVHQLVREFERSEDAFDRFAPVTSSELTAVPCEIVIPPTELTPQLVKDLLLINNDR